MTSDDQLRRDVLAEFEWDSRIDPADIGVAVRDGVVALSGFVKSYAEKVAAEKATRRIAGVRAIAENMVVRFPSDPKTADHEIARRIVDLFDWDVTVPADRLRVKVDDGWVTLSGTVDWPCHREAAWKAAAKIHGVRGITNLVEVSPDRLVGDIKGRIRQAFKRNADLDASQVKVATLGSKVILAGKVKDLEERHAAERAAWNAPGITAVENVIEVAA